MIKPNHLYKYEPFSTKTLENLKGQVIFFGSPLAFNDPFDCALSPIFKEPTDSDIEKIRAYYLSRPDCGEKARREFNTTPTDVLRVKLLRSGFETLEQVRNEFLNNRGVSCFAESPSNLLMWSHYGDHHRGLCLEFRTDMEPLQRARKVTYANEMPEYDLVQLLCDRDFDPTLDLYCTKALDWQYEREWRCLHRDARTPFHYAAEALTGVYFGARTSFESFEIAALILAGQNEHVQLWKGERESNEFNVSFSQITYTSHLEAKRQGLIQPGSAQRPTGQNL